MKIMIVDSHQHVMLPTSMQITKMDDAGVDKVILFTTTPHVERAESATLEAWYAYFSTGEVQHFFALMQTLPERK